ncbi:MAG: MMPL family transporter, partial [Methanomassiliicoccaceae archaeon]|nr:MMPL family transporter [Methanomassiliicoccaceae archaeon]
MGIMSRMGESVAKRPLVPFAVLILITAAALGMIAMNPPSFDMDEHSFTPDNEMTRAQSIISETFTSTASVMILVDARNSGGDIFTQDAFLSILKYEMTLYEISYTGVDGLEHRYSDLPGFRIFSPVSGIASVIAGSQDYDDMILAIELSNDVMIKTVALGTLSGAGSIYVNLLTNDGSDNLKSGNASASGCMISLMITDTGLDLIQGGELGFERDAISTANDFSAANPDGPRIRAMGMETMMRDIGKMAQDDISMLLPIALAIIFILLLLIYRDASDTLVGLLGLLIAVVWTFGISALAGIGISTIAIAVPILILALGIDYSLHLVFRYREERGSGKDSRESIKITMGSVGQALVLATVTTAVAFLSYLTSAMSALADFGLMCAIGIVCAFVSMMLLIPAAQVLRDRRAEKKGKD